MFRYPTHLLSNLTTPLGPLFYSNAPTLGPLAIPAYFSYTYLSSFLARKSPTSAVPHPETSHCQLHSGSLCCPLSSFSSSTSPLPPCSLLGFALLCHRQHRSHEYSSVLTVFPPNHLPPSFSEEVSPFSCSNWAFIWSLGAEFLSIHVPHFFSLCPIAGATFSANKNVPDFSAHV